MNWRDLLLDNVGFKLAAVVVVAMLWISVTADERQAQPVPTRLAIDVRDTSWVLVDGPDEVNTTFQGLNRELLGLLMERPVLDMRIDSVSGERMRLALPVDRVQYDRDLAVVPSFITPQTVDLRFERRRSTRVPVVAEVDAVPAAGYTIVPPIHVEPESVTVRGPATWIEDLDRIATRSVELEDLSATVIRDIPLEVPSAIPGAEVEPSAVLVTINLDSLVVRERRVPIEAVGPGAQAARIRPDSVGLSFRGVASAVDSLMSAVDALTVTIEAPPGRAYEVPLQIDVEAAGPIVVVADPETATVEPLP